MEHIFTVRDLIAMDVDVDVYDDVCEELGIAFCGPLVLTAEGEEHFKEVLDYDCEFTGRGDIVCIIHVDDPVDKVWKRKLRKTKELFESAAGYCSCSDYEKYFKEV